MIYGLSGKYVPESIPGADLFNTWESVPPLMLATIALRETLREYPWAQAITIVASDGGRGLMQLTSSYPDNWQDPQANIDYAAENFVGPALDYWHGLEQFTGDTLALLVFATFNEGLTAARKYHALGDVDAGTTDEYAHWCLATYTSLRDTGALPT